MSRPGGGGGLPIGGQGSKVYVLCAEPKEHKRFRPGARPGGIGFPAGRIGDRDDREIVYVPNVYVISGKKKEPKPKLFGPDIFGWGGGLPRERVGAKKFDTSPETREIKRFGRDIPGFCRDVLEVPEKFEKKMFVFNSRSLYVPFPAPIFGPLGNSGRKRQPKDEVLGAGYSWDIRGRDIPDPGPGMSWIKTSCSPKGPKI